MVANTEPAMWLVPRPEMRVQQEQGMKALRGPLRKKESHLWARQEDDWYVEPAWCSERLFQQVHFPGGIWDPACGCGTIINEARKAGYTAVGSDKVKRYEGAFVFNFLTNDAGDGPFGGSIVSNPPFKHAQRFTEIALENASSKVGFLYPAAWVQGDKRSRWLETTPLAQVLFITPRPSMPPGEVIAAGQVPGNGTSDYAWFIWDHQHRGPATIGWVRK